MNETIDLMLNHTSVRRFTEEPIEAEHLQAIISAGRAASSWKNFQSYSIIVVQSEEKKQAFGAPASYFTGSGHSGFCGRP
ncbi:TPA: nitroreductase family protein [Streptococcus suis]|nr:nitroreductase family protein [Streptococcus suis]